MTDAEYIRKLEDSLCMAINIIRDDAESARMNGLRHEHEILNRRADELIAESGIDFNTVLGRVDEKGNKHEGTAETVAPVADLVPGQAG